MCRTQQGSQLPSVAVHSQTCNCHKFGSKIIQVTESGRKQPITEPQKRSGSKLGLTRVVSFYSIRKARKSRRGSASRALGLAHRPLLAGNMLLGQAVSTPQASPLEAGSGPAKPAHPLRSTGRPVQVHGPAVLRMSISSSNYRVLTRRSASNCAHVPVTVCSWFPAEMHQVFSSCGINTWMFRDLPPRGRSSVLRRG